MLELLYGDTGDGYLAKIAVELDRALARRDVNGAPGEITARMLACGDGWTVEDVVCTSSPRDRPFEERHSHYAIAIVGAGSFQYRSQAGSGRELMTPGSLLLGNAGQCFECGHEHGAGDRCLSFRYTPNYFESLAADTVAHGAKPEFRTLRLPPLRALSPLVAKACAGLARGVDMPWEEISVQLAAQTMQLAGGVAGDRSATPTGAMARETRIVRSIHLHPYDRRP